MSTARSTLVEEALPRPSSPAPSAPNGARRVPGWKRRLSSLLRWLHVYISMASFLVVFFFAATGLTLNHADWFNGHQRTTQFHGSVPAGWVNSPDPERIAKLEIVEHLRRTHSIRGDLTDLRIDDWQCSVSFNGPAYTADAFIDRETGAYDLTETRLGVFALLNDLHKGRDTGRAWSLLIDVSAVLASLVSLTGIFLILFLQRVRFSGLVAAGAGTLLCALVYFIWVP